MWSPKSCIQTQAMKFHNKDTCLRCVYCCKCSRNGIASGIIVPLRGITLSLGASECWSFNKRWHLTREYSEYRRTCLVSTWLSAYSWIASTPHSVPVYISCT
jgi:hypothetical protein